MEVVGVSKSQKNQAIVTICLNDKKEVKCLVDLSHVRLEDGQVEDHNQDLNVFQRTKTIFLKARRVKGSGLFQYEVKDHTLFYSGVF